MTIQECYQQLNGNYEEVIGRLKMPALVERFALKFPDDKSFRELTDFLEEGNVPEAFRAAHTLKGVCANLSFTTLFGHASEVTEFLRSGDLESAKVAYPALAEDYRNVLEALLQFKNNH